MLPSALRRVTIAASLALVLVLLFALAFKAQMAGTSHGTAASVAESYGQLPLAFEQNRGQTDGRVDFLARAAGQSAFLTSTGATVAIQSSAENGRGAAIRLALSGADPAARPVGLERLPGEVNVLRGNDSSKWVTGAPTFARVRYGAVYPGIDLAWHGAQGGQLEYDFVVSPGADPRQIGIRIEGSRDITLTDSGALRLESAAGALIQRPPVAYQEFDGRRQSVEARYRLSGGEVHLVLGSYDPQRRLVIDPVLEYSTYLGGSGADFSGGIAVDSAGASYVTGTTFSTDFPTTAGAFDTSSDSGEDVSVSKLDPAGSSLVYSTFVGGSNGQEGDDVAVDSAGAAYVIGTTSSADFPTTDGAFDTSYNGNDVFVSKLDPAGSGLSYSTYLGGSVEDYAVSIAIDSAEAAYATGITRSTDFPTTAGAFDTSGGCGCAAGAPFDSFVSKLDPAGSSLAYSTYLGASGWDQVEGIAVDSAGAAYLTGFTDSTDYPTTAGAFDTTFNSDANSGDDAFVSKLNPAGSGLGYSTYLGGSSSDEGRGIAADSAGAAFVTGATLSTDFPTTAGAFDTSPNGSNDAFVTKLDPAGSGLGYSTYLGGSTSDGTADIAVDSAGAAYLTGTTDSTDFPTTAGAFDTSYSGGNSDAFVSKLDPAGSALSDSTYLGESPNNSGAAIAVDSGGAAYVAGLTDSPGFPTTAGAFDTSQNGGYDYFVAKFTYPQGPDNSASENAPAGGTVSTNTTTSPDDPVGTSVTTPNAGQVTIQEGTTTTPNPSGYSLLGQQVQITAPTASAASPLVIEFLLDASVLPAGADPASLQVFRDGVPIADCAANAGSSANPDPCVAARAVNGTGGVALTVRTSHASRWNFGLHSAYAFQGYYSPIAAPPTLNGAKAGSAVTLRFSLGGNQGLGIFGSSYPRSHRISCNAAATDLGDDAPASGSLSYDKKSSRYTYTWKTAKAWAGNCRQFVAHLIDGSYHRANFRFSK
jgi:hypothetical protein